MFVVYMYPISSCLIQLKNGGTVLVGSVEQFTIPSLSFIAVCKETFNGQAFHVYIKILQQRRYTLKIGSEWKGRIIE